MGPLVSARNRSQRASQAMVKATEFHPKNNGKMHVSIKAQSEKQTNKQTKNFTCFQLKHLLLKIHSVKEE